MISYKIDKAGLNKVNSDLREIAALLAEISPTLQTLNDMLMTHEQTISSPSINGYRDELKVLTAEATMATKKIADNTDRLIAVSDQAGKHLSAIEDHFGATLRERTTETAPTTV